MRAPWRNGQGVTMPLLMNASQTANTYGQTVESFVVVDHQGLVRFKSDSSVSMARIRSEVAQALADVPLASGVVTAAGWDHALPDTALVGDRLAVDAVVRPALFAQGGEVIRAFADLSRLGGGAEVPLTAMADGTYRLRETLGLDLLPGSYLLEVLIEQQTPDGPSRSRLVQRIVVVPGADLPIFADAAAAHWTMSASRRLDADPSAATPAHRGETVLALQASGGLWSLKYQPDEPLPLLGYQALRFAFHPGAVAQDGFLVLELVDESPPTRGSKEVELIKEAWVDLTVDSWQVVEIDLRDIQDLDVNFVRFRGNLAGAFYLDDIRLVVPAPAPTPTAVSAARQEGVPQAFGLAQNYPNPFNSDTLIRYTLPRTAPVELAIYNLAGQRVARLVEGQRAAGAHSVHWDGRDDAGRVLASGVYLYRLATGRQAQTRKLLLLR